MAEQILSSSARERNLEDFGFAVGSLRGALKYASADSWRSTVADALAALERFKPAVHGSVS